MQSVSSDHLFVADSSLHTVHNLQLRFFAVGRVRNSAADDMNRSLPSRLDCRHLLEDRSTYSSTFLAKSATNCLVPRPLNLPGPAAARLLAVCRTATPQENRTNGHAHGCGGVCFACAFAAFFDAMAAFSDAAAVFFDTVAIFFDAVAIFFDAVAAFLDTVAALVLRALVFIGVPSSPECVSGSTAF